MAELDEKTQKAVDKAVKQNTYELGVVSNKRVRAIANGIKDRMAKAIEDAKTAQNKPAIVLLKDVQKDLLAALKEAA